MYPMNWANTDPFNLPPGTGVPGGMRFFGLMPNYAHLTRELWDAAGEWCGYYEADTRFKPFPRIEDANFPVDAELVPGHRVVLPRIGLRKAVVIGHHQGARFYTLLHRKPNGEWIIDLGLPGWLYDPSRLPSEVTFRVLSPMVVWF